MELRRDDTLDVNTRDVRHEDDPISAEPLCQRGRRLVRVDIQGPDRDRRHDRDEPGGECLLDRSWTTRERLADETELGHTGSNEADLVADHAARRDVERCCLFVGETEGTSRPHQQRVPRRS